MQLVTLLAKYSVAGVVNGLVSYAIIFGTMALGMSPVWSNVLGYAAGFATSFFQARRWVFGSKNRLRGDLARFVLSFLVAYAANFVALKLLLGFDANRYLAQVVACCVYVLVGFFLNATIVFKKRSLPESDIRQSSR